MSHSDDGVGRLDRPVDPTRDHVLGSGRAPVTLVEYGSYACPDCRVANDRVTQVRTDLGDRLRYIFRHKPLPNNDLARRAAELAESAPNDEQFWRAHSLLMTRSESLTEEDLEVVARELALAALDDAAATAIAEQAKIRVDADEASARASGVRFTPTFYINGARYEGPWDDSSLADAILGTLGHRVRSAALQFASWAPSTGLLLLLATVLAVVLGNSAWGPAVERFWQTVVGVSAGTAAFTMPLLSWINDGLLTVFFFVVGLEIKREFTIGSLANRRSAALPMAAAVGGMVAPALLYALLIPAGVWSRGWGVPMATDTAFAVALIAMMGRRVPVELRVFLTAAAIVDDIGAIIVVAFAYTTEQHWSFLIAAAGILGLLIVLNRSGVYRAAPYLILGVVLWVMVHESGLHATLAGVLLAACIPTRPPPNYRALAVQADSILRAEASRGGEQLRYGPSAQALRALDSIHDRIESPADRMLRTAAPRSSYLVLPIFALANAGVAITPEVFDGRGPLMLAVTAGLLLGKPLGFVAASALAVRLGIARKPDQYSWRQMVGAGALAGIGFTMSLFIAGQAFPDPGDFAAGKIAVFGASALSAVLGVTILWNASSSSATSAG